MRNRIPEIECPVRWTRISSLECQSCPNRIRVMFRSEFPPELQCSAWRHLAANEWESPSDPPEE